jgi:mono/diheme cytochrome c family protein
MSPLGLALALPLLAGGSAAAQPLERLPSIEALSSGPQGRVSAQRYALNCMGCHGGDGEGVVGRIPPLGELGLFTRSQEGRVFLMQVPGASNSSLGDAELAETLNWMLVRFSRASLLPSFEPYTQQEVAAHRRPALAEVRAKRRLLVQQLRKAGPAPAEQY